MNSGRVMADIFQVFVRVVFLNKLGVNVFICMTVSFLAGILFPLVISKNVVRKISLTNKLVLGAFEKS